MVWRADGQLMKEILVSITNGKHSLKRPRTRWVDVVAKDKENIKGKRDFLLTTERNGETL